MDNLYCGNWGLTLMILAVFGLMMGIIQWQSKRIDAAARRDFKYMEIWMYLTFLQSATEEDAELGKDLRALIIEGESNEKLTKFIQQKYAEQK